MPSLPRDAWVVLGGDFLSAVGSGLVLPFFLVYLSRARGIDIEVAGLIVATIALAGFVGNPVGGWLADRIGPKRALVAGLAVSAAGALAVTLVRLPWHGFAAAALVGFGAAVSWPAQDSLLVRVVAPEQRSSVFSVRYATLNAGFGVGALGAALIADVSSTRSFVLLYLLDAVTFLLFIPFLVIGLRHAGNVPPPVDEGTVATRAPRGFRSVVADRTFRRLWLLTALLVGAGYAQMHAAFPAFATGAGRISAGGLSVVWAANTFTVVVAQLLSLRWMRGRRRTTGLVLVCAFWATAWAVTLVAGGLGGGALAVTAFAGALVVFAVGETLLSPSLAPMVNDLAPDDLRGRYNGVYTLAWTTGFAAGPAIAGISFGAGADGEFFLGLIAVLAVLALATSVLGRHLPPAVNRVPAEEAVVAPPTVIKEVA